MAAIEHPYAYELMLEAQNRTSETCPTISGLNLVEVEGCDGINLIPSINAIEYDPETVMNMSLVDLIEIMGNVVLHMENRKVLLCSVVPPQNDSLH